MTTEQLNEFNETAAETFTLLVAIAAAARDAAAALAEFSDAQDRVNGKL